MSRCFKCQTGHFGSSLCERHEAEAERRFPQGWRFYPGDVCKHRMYVGGSGVDWMCGRCEGGDEG